MVNGKRTKVDTYIAIVSYSWFGHDALVVG